MASSTDTLETLEAKIAAAEKDVQSAKASNDKELLILYMPYLTELMKAKNIHQSMHGEIHLPCITQSMPRLCLHCIWSTQK